MKLKTILAALAATFILLCGCGDETALPDSLPEILPMPTPVQYSIRYYDGEELLLEETVREGSFPAAAPGETGSGLVILRWLDESGNEVEPSALSVGSELCLYAVAAPRFDRHVPYLFPDEYGFLHPDEAFTSGQLEEALRALAGPQYAETIVSLSGEDTPLTAGEMKSYLRRYFTDDALNAAFSPFGADAEVRRADAAVLLNTLLGRSTEEARIPDEGTLMIPDVHPGREDFAQLLEAALPHSHPASGAESSSASLAVPYEAGFLNVNGVLYCIGENGYVLTDQEVGGLYFGADGTYSSGNETLDGYVEDILAGIIAAAPDAERIDWLRGAFNYTRDSFTYLRKNAYSFGATGWEIDDAIVMLESGRGNCYNYAAVFWALARGLGYDARAVSGTIAHDYQPHGWVFIRLDGVDYFCDPEMEMTYILKGDHYHDMFMMTTYTASSWSYTW